MIKEFKNYILSNNLKDNLIFFSMILMPFALNISILVSEILLFVVSITFIIILIKEKEIRFELENIKTQIILLSSLYLIILISLFLSEFFSKSLLPSLFYFRYIIFSLGIFYIIFKNEKCLKYLFISFAILILFILFDGFYELLKINKLFGLKIEAYRGSENYYLTGFFNDEKKLGSFLIRILPFIVSVIIYLNYSKIYHIIIILIFGGLIFLSSERVALFLFLVFLLFFIRVIPNKIYTISFLFLVIFSLTIFQPKVAKKYVFGTFFQMGILQSAPNINGSWSELKNINFKKINYFSEEHENLIKSGIEIFKERPLIGSGVKTHYNACNKIKLEKNEDLICSTHPHNTYIQLLSDTGIFSAVIFLFVFFYTLYLNIKIFFKKNISNIYLSIYVLNIGIILNLMPFIPSGSIYNNWINIMIYFPIGYWFYLYLKIKRKSA